MPSPAKPRRRPTRDARVADIVEAATRLFSERGPDRTSIASIAAEVGISDAGVLYHFPTKQHLLMAVIEVTNTDPSHDFRSRVKPGGLAALEALGGWGEVMVQEPRHMSLHLMLSAEGIRSDPELHRYFTGRYRRVTRWIEQAIQAGIDRGEIRADVDAHVEARDYLAYLDGLRVQWHYGPSTDIAGAVRRYVENLIERVAA